MELIITGLLLWSIVHLIPAAVPSLREGLISRLGENTYKLLFTLTIIISITLMVYGWKHSITTDLYQPIAILKPLALVLVFFSFLLFASAILPTRLLRLIRHPQLMFVISWALAHLLLNGDSRSVIVFGSLGIWALLEMFFINKRDGGWTKTIPPSLAQELKSLLLSIFLFAVAMIAHYYVSGIALNF